MSASPLDPTSRRALVLLPLLLALLTMIGPLNIDTPLPAFAVMREEFGASTTQMQLVITVYMVAFALMSVFHGPLSDAVGRKPVIFTGLVLYVGASVGVALSPDLAWVLVFRALQGLTAGAATIVSRTVIRDVFEGAQAQRLMSLMMIVFGLAPAVAPIIGGGLLQLGSWHLIFWFTAVFGVLLVAATVLTLPETHPPARRTALSPAAILGGLSEVFRSAAFHRVAWAGSFLFGAMFLYIAGASILLTDLLGYGELDFWRLFLPLIVAMTIGSAVSARAAGRIEPSRVVHLGFGVALFGGVLGVVLNATTLGDHLGWSIVGCCVVALGSGTAFPSLQLMAMDLFPERRGAATSGTAFVQLMCSASSAVALAPVMAISTFAFAATSLAFVAAGLVCWVWHCRVGAAERVTRRAA